MGGGGGGRERSEFHFSKTFSTMDPIAFPSDSWYHDLLRTPHIIQNIHLHVAESEKLQLLTAK